MSWCERTMKKLIEKGRDNWTEDDYETYYYCEGTLDSIAAEIDYLNGEGSL